MSPFETFARADATANSQPTLTIQKRGTLTLNAAAYAALGCPSAVELLYDQQAKRLGLRPTTVDVEHAVFVRRPSRYARGPRVISAMAFVNHYGIDTRVARRWDATLEGDTLCVRLDEAGTDVSRT